MDMFGSINLKELPDLSNAKKLEILRVSDCWSLVELPPSMANLHKLERLEMDFCEKLQGVPHLNLASLHHVLMRGCWQLRNIPDISRNITELIIADTMLEQVPDSIWFCPLTNFRIMGNIDAGAGIEKIPDWIKDLSRLEMLYISDCTKLASLPELPASLLILSVATCESLETITPFPVDSPIEELYFPNCFKLDREARRVINQEPFKACLPGRTIPTEFNQRAFGNSLTIRSGFEEFMICVMVSPTQPMEESGIVVCGNLFCDIHINGCPIDKDTIHYVFMTQTENLYMSYVSFSHEDEGWLEQDNEILFEIRTTSHEVAIIECGVQTLLEDDDESLSDG